MPKERSSSGTSALRVGAAGSVVVRCLPPPAAAPPISLPAASRVPAPAAAFVVNVCHVIRQVLQASRLATARPSTRRFRVGETLAAAGRAESKPETAEKVYSMFPAVEGEKERVGSTEGNASSLQCCEQVWQGWEGLHGAGVRGWKVFQGGKQKEQVEVQEGRHGRGQSCSRVGGEAPGGRQVEVCSKRHPVQRTSSARDRQMALQAEKQQRGARACSASCVCLPAICTDGRS